MSFSIFDVIDTNNDEKVDMTEMRAAANKWKDLGLITDKEVQEFDMGMTMADYLYDQTVGDQKMERQGANMAFVSNDTTGRFDFVDKVTEKLNYNGF